MTDTTSTPALSQVDKAIVATLRRVRFATASESNQTALMHFADPIRRDALSHNSDVTMPAPELSAPDEDGVDILTVPLAPKENPNLREEMRSWVCASAAPGSAPPVVVSIQGAQVFWRAGRAAILAASDKIEPLLLALMEFGYYENEIRKLEREIGDSWPELEADSPLAYDVTPRDLNRHEIVGRRMGQVLQRRMRHSRIEPHCYRTSAQLAAPAQELGEMLRDKARIEDRLEALDGHLEVFEHVYEMSSQRISEFRAARKEQTLEWAIIVLLAVETLLLLMDLLWKMEV